MRTGGSRASLLRRDARGYFPTPRNRKQSHFKATWETRYPRNERFNRTLREEFLEAGNAYDDPDVFNRGLTAWLVEYTAHRPTRRSAMCHQCLSSSGTQK